MTVSIEQLYGIFGNTLPEKHIFFATQGTPDAVVFEKTFGSWNDFSNEYLRFAAKTGKATAKVASRPVKGGVVDAKAKDKPTE